MWDKLGHVHCAQRHPGFKFLRCSCVCHRFPRSHFVLGGYSLGGMASTKILLACLLACACTQPTVGGWLGGDKKTSETAPIKELEDGACRVHSSMVSPASLKKELPADEAALQVRTKKEWRRHRVTVP